MKIALKKKLHIHYNIGYFSDDGSSTAYTQIKPSQSDERSTRRSLVILGLIFLASIVALTLVAYSFPKLDEWVFTELSFLAAGMHGSSRLVQLLFFPINMEQENDMLDEDSISLKLIGKHILYQLFIYIRIIAYCGWLDFSLVPILWI